MQTATGRATVNTVEITMPVQVFAYVRFKTLVSVRKFFESLESVSKGGCKRGKNVGALVDHAGRNRPLT